MNLSILPPILEEEMLSAYIDRLLSVHPRLTKRSVVATIFGRPWRDASVQLPKHIDWAARCFGDSLSSETTSQWIAAHTLYPFFANFLSEPAQQKLYLRMVSGGYGPLHQCGGRLVPRRKFVRVCQDCARSDIDEFGFYRIFRSHMVCYVNCCAVHNRTLIEVVECNAWSAPPDSTSFNNTPHPRAQLISRIASELIQRQPQLGLKNALHEETAVGLNMLGLLTFTSRLKMRLALSLLREHYANVPLSAPFQETLNSSHLEVYLRSTIASKRSIHPAAYLLLAAFIQECSGELANRAAVTTVPWTTRTARPTQEELYRLLKGFKTLSSASVFLNSSVTTLSTVARKYGLDFGFKPSSATDGVRQEAIGLLRGGMAPSLVAQQLQISISAVYRIRRANPELVSELSVRGFERQRTKRRESFLALAITHPGLGGASLRARDKSLWAWLYRNDRVWLTEHTPEKSRAHAHGHHSLWPRLETMLLPIIEEAIRSMVARKHERITLTALFRVAGVRQIAQQKLVEMPTLRVLIESALEDPASYVNRRLLTAADEIGASYSTSFSAIVRAATLRPTTVQRAGVDATSWNTLFASRRASDAH
jgi:hypothetical protein